MLNKCYAKETTDKQGHVALKWAQLSLAAVDRQGMSRPWCVCARMCRCVGKMSSVIPGRAIQILFPPYTEIYWASSVLPYVPLVKCMPIRRGDTLLLCSAPSQCSQVKENPQQQTRWETEKPKSTAHPGCQHNSTWLYLIRRIYICALKDCPAVKIRAVLIFRFFYSCFWIVFCRFCLISTFIAARFTQKKGSEATFSPVLTLGNMTFMTGTNVNNHCT